LLTSTLVSAPWAVALSADAVHAQLLRGWWASAQRAYPANTRRAWASDWQVYQAFCEARDLISVPGSAIAIARFVAERAAAGKQPATIRRYLATIALAHRSKSS